VTCYDEFLAARRAYPRALVLMRIGDFYEAVGWDAVLLMEHTGIAAMSPEGGVPLAGTQHRNLRRTLSLLVRAGLTVAVVEEEEEEEGDGGGAHAHAPLLRLPGRAAKGAKRRYVGGVVSPCAPEYLRGLVDDEHGWRLAAMGGAGGAAAEAGFRAARPIVGALFFV
jgi:hypothetical protein